MLPFLARNDGHDNDGHDLRYLSMRRGATMIIEFCVINSNFFARVFFRRVRILRTIYSGLPRVQSLVMWIIPEYVPAGYNQSIYYVCALLNEYCSRVFRGGFFLTLPETAGTT